MEQEDSYPRLDNMEGIKKELLVLTGSLLRRMRIDLTRRTDEAREGSVLSPEIASVRQWAGRPRTLRLTTRPRTLWNPDGSRSKSFTRISKSCNMPSVAFSSLNSIEAIAEKIVHNSLIPLFHRLHPETSDWDLSLINVCATNIPQPASNDCDGAGRDIGSMFAKQVDVLKEWKVEDGDVCNDLKVQRSDDMDHDTASLMAGADILEEAFVRERKDQLLITSDGHVGEDASNLQGPAGIGRVCGICGAYMPSFVILAHERYHIIPD
jgi:DNA polymerase iota